MMVFNLQKDATLLAHMADSVRPEDVSKGSAYNQLIGIVVGPDVKVCQFRKAAVLADELGKGRPGEKVCSCEDGKGEYCKLIFEGESTGGG